MSESDELMSHSSPWNRSIESLLAKYCDQSKCFEWMHSKAYSLYERRARIISILSTILFALSGISNVIAGNISSTSKLPSIIFGSLTILFSLGNLLKDKLAYETRASEHNSYMCTWGIIRRKIEDELSIPRPSRKDCQTFLKVLKQDINQVSNEGNAKIPEFIRDLCYDKFNTIKDFDVPDICGQIEHTNILIEESEKNSLVTHTPISINSNST